MGEVGISPKDYYNMTEHVYFKICIGHNNKRLNELKLHRHMAYVVYSGYADPKSKVSIEKFMPLDGDVITTYTPPPVEKLKEWDNKFKNLKRKK